jgi:hypothetical protein
MTFPVEILAEKDNRVMFRMDQMQLLGLIAKEGVIGIGSRNRIKRLRVNTVISQQAERVYRESRYSRESLKFTYEEQMENHPVALKRVGPGGRFERWPENETFPRNRFNPDRIPESIIGGLRTQAA